MISPSIRPSDRPIPGVGSPRTRIAVIVYTGMGILALTLLSPAAALRSVWIAPLVEETVLRLGVQDALSRRFPRLAPVLAALAFAAAHLLFAHGLAQCVQAAATALPACWIGLGYARTRRLAPCVAWHAAFNLAWLCGLGAVFFRLAGA